MSRCKISFKDYFIAKKEWINLILWGLFGKEILNLKKKNSLKNSYSVMNINIEISHRKPNNTGLRPLQDFSGDWFPTGLVKYWHRWYPYFSLILTPENIRSNPSLRTTTSLLCSIKLWLEVTVVTPLELLKY